MIVYLPCRMDIPHLLNLESWKNLASLLQLYVQVLRFLVKFPKLLYLIDPLDNMQYSVFGSIGTVGGLIGGLVNGRLADIMGRRYVSSSTSCILLHPLVSFQVEIPNQSLLFVMLAQAMWFSETLSTAGWLAIAFGKVFLFPLNN